MLRMIDLVFFKRKENVMILSAHFFFSLVAYKETNINNKIDKLELRNADSENFRSFNVTKNIDMNINKSVT